MSNAKDYVSMLDFFEVLWKGKVFIFSVTALCVLLAVFFSFSQSRRYCSELVISVGTVGRLSGSDVVKIDDVSNVLALIKSKPFVFSVISKNNLSKNGKLMDPGDLDVDAEVEKNSTLIHITAEGSSPKEASKCVTAVAGEIVERHRIKFSEAMRVSKDMETDLITQIENSEREVNGLRQSIARIEAHPAVNAPAVILLRANLNESTGRLSSLKSRLREIQLAHSRLQSENTKIVDPAILSDKPVGPGFIRLALLAGAFGFILAVFGVAIRGALNRKRNI